MTQLLWRLVYGLDCPFLMTTKPHIRWVLFSLKRPGIHADHSLAPMAKVKN